MKKYIAILICAVFCCGIMAAQGKIDKVINSLEDKNDVETTYTERRSPKKKKLVMTSRIFNFSNRAYYEKLCKAMEDERSNSVSAVKTKTQMTYRFDDDKGVSTYTLSCTAGGSAPYVMVMTWRSNSADDSSFLEESDMQTLTYETADGSRVLINYSTGECMQSRKEAVKARREAAKIRRDAMAKARREAVKARREAAKARREAAKARREAERARRSASHNVSGSVVYQL